MRPLWAGEIIGKMFVYEIAQYELAEEMGYTVGHINQILQGKRPGKKLTRMGIEQALEKLIEQRKKEEEARNEADNEIG